MTALIARLEAATAGSRELDKAIWLAIGESPMKLILCPHYTTSIDAALTLVPKGHWWSAGDCRRESHARVAPEKADNDGHEGFGATVAIALCIAALKARIAP